MGRPVSFSCLNCPEFRDTPYTESPITLGRFSVHYSTGYSVQDQSVANAYQLARKPLAALALMELGSPQAVTCQSALQRATCRIGHSGDMVRVREQHGA